MASLPINSARLRRLFLRILDIYSPTGKEEQLVDYLHGYLKRRGLPVVRQEVDEDRDNLVVAPTGADAAAAIVGHLDTVTAYDLDDFGAWAEAGRIIGLGSADMKGGCAAMIEAFLSLFEQGHTDLPVTLALVVGEEEEGDGAEALVKEYHFPWALVGEPTDLQPCLSTYGYLEVQVATRGERLHASLAREGQNATLAMLHLLLRLTSFFQGRGAGLVYNLRDLFTSGGGFVVPDACEAWLDVHLPADQALADVILEMEELLETAAREHPDLDAVLRFNQVEAGYALPERGPLVEALKDVYARFTLAWEPRPFPSHSDANQLWAAGVKSILLGPGQLEQAHRPDESIDFAQVESAAAIYYHTALSLKERG
ncbi:MAG: M20/M25/M40 family metallo-hydrolase [Pseudomonadota bacterium]